MAKVVRHSGLQREVLRLYKDFMKAINKKPVATQASLKDYVRSQFKEKAKLSTRDIKRNEYLINLGRKQLKTLKLAETEGFTLMGAKSPFDSNQSK